MKQLNFYLMNNILLLIMMLIMILISVAFLTLFERKILSYSHYRKGPNKVSYMGLLQPFSDAMKLLSKEYFYPLKSNYMYYFISPMIMFLIIMMNWLLYPFLTNLFSWNYNVLFFLCMMSMGVYGLMISGWSSNSSFSMLGSIRSISQSISYEVTFSITLLMSLLMYNTLNFYLINYYHKYLLMLLFMWPISLILLVSMIAEINRTPFDLSEGESELVSGFNIEYSSVGFVLIFLSEYASIMFMMYFFNFLYMNMDLYYMWFYLFVIFFLFFIIWLRVTLPRIRYDYLMIFCWFYMLPFLLIMFIFYLIFFKLLLDLIILY